MKREATVHIKSAIDLRVGDQILSHRMTVVEVAKIEVSDGWGDRSAIHITTIAPHATGMCFLEDEEVLVVG
jgi:hypothetical protein